MLDLRIFAATIAFTALLASCTNGSRCDGRHPCYPEDTCVDGFCVPSSEVVTCANGGEPLGDDLCRYELNDCDRAFVSDHGTFAGFCTTRCSVQASAESNGDCPEGYDCIGEDGEPPFYCFNAFSDLLCDDATDCVGAVIEVPR